MESEIEKEVETKTAVFKRVIKKDRYDLIVVVRYLGEMSLGATVINISKNNLRHNKETSEVRKVVGDCILHYFNTPKSEIFTGLKGIDDD